MRLRRLRQVSGTGSAVVAAVRSPAIPTSTVEGTGMFPGSHFFTSIHQLLLSNGLHSNIRTVAARLKTADDLQGMNVISGGPCIDEWCASSNHVTKLDETSFFYITLAH
jgi:hypothetical protein